MLRALLMRHFENVEVPPFFFKDYLGFKKTKKNLNQETGLGFGFAKEETRGIVFLL